MARPVRYEAAGAVYHVMARGDGGRDVFVKGVSPEIQVLRFWRLAARAVRHGEAGAI